MIGYCCINNTLRPKDVFTSRSMTRKCFTLDKASDLALRNSIDLLTILKWNKANEINVFRLSSDFFPRMTDTINRYSIDDLKDSKAIKLALAEAGSYASQNNMILSCHPNPFTVLGSSNPSVILNAIAEVEMHDLLGNLLFPNNECTFNVNFHVGCGFSEQTAKIFCESFSRLSLSARNRVVIENDDKVNGWSVQKLYKYIYSEVGTPITFDYHHSNFSREVDISPIAEFKLASSTWGRIMEVHVSESADNDKMSRKHAGFITTRLPDYLFDRTYILFEAKEKELAVLKYRKEHTH